MTIVTQNKGAAPNRRLRLGLLPWSFGFSKSQGSAVGELGRSASFEHHEMVTGLSSRNVFVLARELFHRPEATCQLDYDE